MKLSGTFHTRRPSNATLKNHLPWIPSRKLGLVYGFIYFILNYVYRGQYVHISAVPKEARGIDSPGSEVRDRGEPPDLGAGNGIQALLPEQHGLLTPEPPLQPPAYTFQSQL